MSETKTFEISRITPDASGASFGVIYQGDTVRIVPSPMLARVCEYKPSALNTLLESRKTDLQLLASICSTVDGLLVPNILEWDPGDENRLGNLVVQRARGIELGANLQFMNLQEHTKMHALTIYLNAIKHVNASGKVYGDKNSSGLFIVPEKEKCKLRMVDPGLISTSPEDISSLGGINRIEFEGRPSMTTLLESFFTPNSTLYPDMVPVKIQNLVTSIKNHEITSVSQLLQEISI